MQSPLTVFRGTIKYLDPPPLGSSAARFCSLTLSQRGTPHRLFTCSHFLSVVTSEARIIEKGKDCSRTIVSALWLGRAPRPRRHGAQSFVRAEPFAQLWSQRIIPEHPAVWLLGTYKTAQYVAHPLFTHFRIFICQYLTLIAHSQPPMSTAVALRPSTRWESSKYGSSVDRSSVASALPSSYVASSIPNKASTARRSRAAYSSAATDASNDTSSTTKADRRERRQKNRPQAALSRAGWNLSKLVSNYTTPGSSETDLSKIDYGKLKHATNTYQSAYGRMKRSEAPDYSFASVTDQPTEFSDLPSALASIQSRFSQSTGPDGGSSVYTWGDDDQSMRDVEGLRRLLYKTGKTKAMPGIDALIVGRVPKTEQSEASTAASTARSSARSRSVRRERGRSRRR